MKHLIRYEDFMSYAGGVYKHVSGRALGLHAVKVRAPDDPPTCPPLMTRLMALGPTDPPNDDPPTCLP